MNAPKTQGKPPRRHGLTLHPENPRYFLFRGKPTLLIGAAEHLGAIINRDFDFDIYFDELARHGFNLTRALTGTLVEPRVGGNPLEPSAEGFLPPWARSKTPGNKKGGNKFDLTKHDPAYFARLRDLVAAAGARGIVVDVVLFAQLFNDHQWSVAPFNPENNVNDFRVSRFDVYTLDRHRGLLDVQEALVRKAVDVLRGADNVLWELSLTRDRELATAAWERHMLDVLKAAQRRVGDRKLVVANLGSGRDPGETIDLRISVLSHNMADQNLLSRYAGDRRPLGVSLTGFVPSTDDEARYRAWDFIVGGVSLFVHVDMSFSASDPRGRRLATPDARFGCGPVQRAQLQVLRELMSESDVVRMAPAPALLTSALPPALSARILAEPGRSYLAYLRPARRSEEVSIRWTGRLVPKTPGRHRLITVSNDGVKLWLDGKLIIDNWMERALAENAADVELTARGHDLKVEYFRNTGNPIMRLEWQPPGGERVLVPATSFRTPDRRGPGLRAEYFADPRLETLHVARTDAVIEHTLDRQAAFARPAWAGGTVPLALDVPAGRYELSWLDPASGGRFGWPTAVVHGGGALALTTPSFKKDLAVRLVRRDGSA